MLRTRRRWRSRYAGRFASCPRGFPFMVFQRTVPERSGDVGRGAKLALASSRFGYYVRPTNKTARPLTLHMMRSLLLAFAVVVIAAPARAEDGSELWLRYRLTAHAARLA